MSESNSESNTAVSGEQDVSAASRNRPGSVALAVYRWGLLVFLAAGVVQIFLAGLGTFRLLHGAGDSAFDPHRMLGFAMAGIAIIVLILTLIARPGARAIVGAVLLVPLTSLRAEPARGPGRRSRDLRRPARRRWPAHHGHPRLPVHLVRAPDRMSSIARAAAPRRGGRVGGCRRDGGGRSGRDRLRLGRPGYRRRHQQPLRPAGRRLVRHARSPGRPARRQCHRVISARGGNCHRHLGSCLRVRGARPEQSWHPASSSSPACWQSGRLRRSCAASRSWSWSFRPRTCRHRAGGRPDRSPCSSSR